MSISLMTDVWKYSKQSATSLLLLLAIADFANDENLAWPTIETLAIKIRLGVRQTQRLIRELIKSGELSIVDSKTGRGNSLILRVTSLSPFIEQERVTSRALKGDIQGIKNIKRVTSRALKGDIQVTKSAATSSEQKQSTSQPSYNHHEEEENHHEPPCVEMQKTTSRPCELKESARALAAKRKPPEMLIMFTDAFLDKFKVKYKDIEKGEAIVFNRLKGVQGELLTATIWARAIENYFNSLLSSYTIADLCTRFAVFQQSSLDRFSRPIALKSPSIPMQSEESRKRKEEHERLEKIKLERIKNNDFDGIGLQALEAK